MKPARICNVPTCPEIVENSNGKCSKHHRLAKRAADKRTGRVRGSRWTQLRRTVLQNKPFCNCRDCDNSSHVTLDGKTRCREPATEVDHIIPLSHGGHPTALTNLQGLCHACHEHKTRREYHGKVIE